ncbi:MAG: pantothenate kinase [Spirochaetaceae bacterium]|jgi:type II pantothenate kinase|nr:pantothenate kinase [Spirochaetaceae bacterium]
MIVGIDIGSTITKAVSIEEGSVIRKVKTKAVDAVTSATGAFGKMLVENGIKLTDIEKIRITGAGSSKIKDDIFGIPTEKIDEVRAIGVGGLFLAHEAAGLSPEKPIVIANIGTGTILIEASKDRIAHLGGSGVGGGTILGLSKRLISLSAFNDIMGAAKDGNRKPVDLMLEDIMESDISFLRRESTAANFGKMLDTAKNEDIALAILGLVFEVIGMLSVFAARGKHIDNVLITGSGSDNPIGKKSLDEIGSMYHIRFVYPPDAQYTTAIGAGLA